MKIGTRLSMGFGLSILITIIVGSYSLSKMQALADLTENMYRHPLTVSNTVRDIRSDIIAMHRSMKDVALAKTIEQIEEAAVIITNYEQRVHNKFHTVLDHFSGNIDYIENTHQVLTNWKIIRDEIIELSKQEIRD